MKKYLLGVDGGNTKTDICIFDESGNFISHMRFGTCSHEAFKNGFEGAKNKLDECIKAIIRKAGIDIADIKASAFGLAGIDLPYQQKKFESIIPSLGLNKFIACNDGLLGVKAGSDGGTGICSINGTGTVCVGIDSRGVTAQIGGLGEVFGDDAGSISMAYKSLRRVYDDLYRCQKKTAMTEHILRLLNCAKKNFVEEVISQIFSGKIEILEILQILFDCADNDDKVAMGLLDETALQLAYNVAGCIRELKFANSINIILAGSVWCKASTPIMIDRFKSISIHW